MIMNAIQLFLDSMAFVANQNMFWGSMGFTTGIAIFIGVLLYNGNFDQAKKGMVSAFSYGVMIMWTTLIRILPNALDRGFKYSDGRPFAGLATIIFITFFWFLGLFIGVSVFKLKRFR